MNRKYLDTVTILGQFDILFCGLCESSTLLNGYVPLQGKGSGESQAFQSKVCNTLIFHTTVGWTLFMWLVLYSCLLYLCSQVYQYMTFYI